MERPSVALETLGCRLNQAESEELARRFLAAGYRLVSPGEGADVYILNTCTVTGVADRKARRWLRWARRCNPSALVVAAGCYAERAASEVSKMPEVNLAVGNHAKEDLVSLVQDRLVSRPPKRLPKSSGFAYPPSYP
ncbi:MAG: tRNA (N(6)-L-threonylcarbamoyladenosine(37)-C(2))-methylthiotransferase MtaB, partial [Chloroflexota bacterium]|nr:tRNA (N(6)-L-threonylcarbamoyladenosine(37)-C(2))-methylthiotransferase MtaB [Chloroflexota bacterium]